MEEEKETGRRSSEAGAMTDSATISNVAEEAGNAPSASDNRAHSNGRSKKNKHGNGILTAESRVGTTQPICDRGRQKLLHLWRI